MPIISIRKTWGIKSIGKKESNIPFLPYPTGYLPFFVHNYIVSTFSLLSEFLSHFIFFMLI